MEIGDSPVGVHHRQIRSGFQAGRQIGFDLRPFLFINRIDFQQQISQAVVIWPRRKAGCQAWDA